MKTSRGGLSRAFCQPWHLPWLLAGLLACSSDKTTEVVVEIVSDLSVPSEIDGLDIRVEVSDVVRWNAVYRLGQPPESLILPQSIVLAPREGDSGTFSISVRATLGSDPTPVVERALTLGFVPGESRLLRIELRRDCRGKSCGSQTCSRCGRCEDGQVDPRTMPRYDPTRIPGPIVSSCADGGADGPTADGGAQDARDGGPDVPAEAAPDRALDAGLDVGMDRSADSPADLAEDAPSDPPHADQPAEASADASEAPVDVEPDEMPDAPAEPAADQAPDQPPADQPSEPAVEPTVEPTVEPAIDPPADAAPDRPGDPAPEAAVDRSEAGPVCDEVAKTGCPTGQKCSVVCTNPPTMGCRTAGTRTEGQTCAADSECAAGLICICVGGGNCTAMCYRFCRTDADCTAPQTCIGAPYCTAGGPTAPTRYCR